MMANVIYFNIFYNKAHEQPACCVVVGAGTSRMGREDSGTGSCLGQEDGVDQKRGKERLGKDTEEERQGAGVTEVFCLVFCCCDRML